MALPLEDFSPEDFDFIIGDWNVKHRRLNERLCGCNEWTEFSGCSSTRKTLGGFGNLEDNILEFPEGTFRAVAMRSYCPTAKTWSIWWLDGRNPTQLDTPVVGRFEGATGLFYADDTVNSRPVKIRFTWSAVANEGPRWEQAFSADCGATWETNWTMQFVSVKSDV
jgi:hypothetical protein